MKFSQLLCVRELIVGFFLQPYISGGKYAYSEKG